MNDGEADAFAMRLRLSGSAVAVGFLCALAFVAVRRVLEGLYQRVSRGVRHARTAVTDIKRPVRWRFGLTADFDATGRCILQGIENEVLCNPVQFCCIAAYRQRVRAINSERQSPGFSYGLHGFA